MRPITSAAPCLGYLVVYSLGLILDYHQLLLVYLPALVLLSVCQFWVPPSPLHCVSKGKVEQAKRVIACLKRGISTNAVDTEIQNTQNKMNRQERVTIEAALASLSEPATRYALIIAFSLASLAQLSGAPTLLAVLEPALLSAQVSRHTSLLCIAVGVLLASLVSPSLTARCGCRKTLITAFIVMACSMSVFGLYLVNLENKMNVSNMSWVPPICLLVHLSAFQLGVNTDAIIGHIFNPQFQIVGLVLSRTVGFLFAFICAIAYFPLNSYLDTSVVAWMFAFSCLVAVLFNYLCVPDTPNMTPTEIHNFLSGGQCSGASLCKTILCR